MLEAAVLRSCDLVLHIRHALPILLRIDPALAGAQAARALRRTGCIDVDSTAREAVRHEKVVVHTAHCRAALRREGALHEVDLRGAGHHKSHRDRHVAGHIRLSDQVDMLSTANLADVGCDLVHLRTGYVDAGCIDHTDILTSHERLDHHTGLVKLHHHTTIGYGTDIDHVAVPAHHGLGHHMKR